MPARPAGVHVIFTLVVPGVPDTDREGNPGDTATMKRHSGIFERPHNYNKLNIEAINK